MIAFLLLFEIIDFTIIIAKPSSSEVEEVVVFFNLLSSEYHEFMECNLLFSRVRFSPSSFDLNSWIINDFHKIMEICGKCVANSTGNRNFWHDTHIHHLAEECVFKVLQFDELCVCAPATGNVSQESRRRKVKNKTLGDNNKKNPMEMLLNFTKSGIVGSALVDFRAKKKLEIKFLRLLHWLKQFYWFCWKIHEPAFFLYSAARCDYGCPSTGRCFSTYFSWPAISTNFWLTRSTASTCQNQSGEAN
jgi:hypothetical protein